MQRSVRRLDPACQRRDLGGLRIQFGDTARQCPVGDQRIRVEQQNHSALRRRDPGIIAARETDIGIARDQADVGKFRPDHFDRAVAARILDQDHFGAQARQPAFDQQRAEAVADILACPVRHDHHRQIERRFGRRHALLLRKRPSAVLTRCLGSRGLPTVVARGWLGDTCGNAMISAKTAPTDALWALRRAVRKHVMVRGDARCHARHPACGEVRECASPLVRCGCKQSACGIECQRLAETGARRGDCWDADRRRFQQLDLAFGMVQWA